MAKLVSLSGAFLTQKGEKKSVHWYLHLSYFNYWLDIKSCFSIDLRNEITELELLLAANGQVCFIELSVQYSL